MSSNEVKFDHNTHKVYAEHEELHDDAILDNSSVLDTPDDGVSEHRLVFGPLCGPSFCERMRTRKNANS